MYASSVRHVLALLFLTSGCGALRMSIGVFGATGLLGREVTQQALSRGIAVRTLCRDPSKLIKPLGTCGEAEADKPIEDERLYKYRGSVTMMDDVEKVFEAGDVQAVVVALGGKTSETRRLCHEQASLRSRSQATSARRCSLTAPPTSSRR